MCGIVGIEFFDDAKTHDIKNWIKKTLTISSRRGKDSSGLSFLSQKNNYFNLSTFRSENSIEKTINQKEINDYIDNIYNKKNSRIRFVIGHTRLATNGNTINANNQPLLYNNNNSSLVFNGIICNSNKLIRLAKIKKNSLNDGVALWSLDKSNKFLKKIKGAFSFVKIHCLKKVGVSIMTNNGSLYQLTKPTKIIKNMFLSEESFFKKLNIYDYKQVKINQQILINFTSENKITKPTLTEVKSKEINKVTIFAIKKSLVSKKIKNRINNRIDYVLKKIKRCSKCILPNTHPFISFDMNGVCNFCLNHKDIPLQSKENFIKKIQLVNKKYGGKAILSSLSGGRDSSYALHILAHKLKIKPITYTYDWGFNTDIARRNVSIMTGELNLENIIIAADIRKKRENVKKNIIAWLKKPHLGIVPLFMAGDKQFISNANILKKELGIKLEIFSANKYEVTQFKEEFSGFKMWDDQNKSEHTNMRLISQIKMLYFYGLQFLLNHHYINSSIFDTLRGFINYYHSRVNELRIYDYYDWNENIINKTLIEKYGWETADDTSSTWRIGDGTQPFYNFIYFLFAGFTENDVLRSFLIRDKKINRDNALNIAIKENQPRYSTLEGYLNIVNIDSERTLSRILKLSEKYKLL
jgi:predicted glutamine amidotransferase